MTSSQINTLENTVQTEDVPRPSNIKIRFKKGTVFASAANASAGEDVVISQLPIRLSPENEKKRKAVEYSDSEEDEHLVSDIPSLMWNMDI